jgi:hypothetical protein
MYPPPAPPPPTITYSISLTPIGTTQVFAPVVVPDKVKVLITYEPLVFSVQFNPPTAPVQQPLTYGETVENPEEEE